MKPHQAPSEINLTIIFWTLLAACVVWILSLPVFPSQDVPVHLYYVQILGKLLHHSTEYAGFFSIRSLLSVYSLYYYLLLGLTTFMSPLVADKLIVCLIVVLFACGFSMLARTLGEFGRLASLFIFPVILSWPLGMGFHSFCLSAALGMFALALWFRARQGSASFGNSIASLALLAIMMITHPVPLILVLLLFSCEIVVRLATMHRVALKERLTKVRIALITLAIAYCTLLFVFRFTDKGAVATNVAAVHSSIAYRAKQLGLLRTFGLFGDGGNLIRAYKVYLFLTLALPLSIALWTWGKRQTGRTLLGFWLGITLLLIVGLPLLPEKINGSGFFADRLMMFVWVAALAAFACVGKQSRLLTRVFVVAACGMVVLILVEGEMFIRPVARQIALVEAAPLTPLGTDVGAGVGVTSEAEAYTPRLTYSPLLWQSARFFRRQDATLLNAPWLDLPILPLGAGPKLFTGELPQGKVDVSYRLIGDLPRIVDLRAARQEPPVGFVLYTHKLHVPEAHPALPMELRSLPGWSCHDDALFLLCKPAGGIR